jgi:hypothetical protein
MRSLTRRFIPIAATALVVCLGSARLHAISIRDIIELSRAGLSDEVLLALIETDKTVFTLSNEQLVLLKQSGVSDRVVIAMVEQGRKPAKPATPPPAATAPPAVSDTGDAEPQLSPANAPSMQPVPQSMPTSSPGPRPYSPYTSYVPYGGYGYGGYGYNTTTTVSTPSTTVVVVPTPVIYPYPVVVPDQRRAVRCQPGRIIGRTERVDTAVSGRWIQNGRTGGMVFFSDPICQ